MKKLLGLAVFAAAVLLSCSQGDEGGSVVLRFNPGTEAKAAGTVAYTHVRVFLVSSNNAFFLMPDGGYYAEQDIRGNSTVSIENIPAGNWNVIISAGTKSGTVFNTTRYGESGSVYIASGVSTQVSVVLSNTPVASGTLAGKSVKAVVSLPDAVYASDDSSVYAGSSVDVMASLASLPAGYSVNSVSKGTFFASSIGQAGVPELWVNTNKGIVPYRNGQYVTTFQKDSINVTKSGALYNKENGELVVFYQRPKGLGGVYVAYDNRATPESWDWITVDQLQGVISGELILDLAMRQDNGYFATVLGSFIMSKDTMKGITSGSDVMSKATFFEVSKDGAVLQIVSLGFGPGTTMYIGTAKGVFKAELDAQGIPKSFTVVSGLASFPCYKIAVSDQYAAFMGDYEVMFLDLSTNVLRKLPFYAGLPGRLTDMVWNDAGTSLFISGSSFTSTGAEYPLGKGGLVSISSADISSIPLAR